MLHCVPATCLQLQCPCYCACDTVRTQPPKYNERCIPCEKPRRTIHKNEMPEDRFEKVGPKVQVLLTSLVGCVARHLLETAHTWRLVVDVPSV